MLRHLAIMLHPSQHHVNVGSLINTLHRIWSTADCDTIHRGGGGGGITWGHTIEYEAGNELERLPHDVGSSGSPAIGVLQGCGGFGGLLPGQVDTNMNGPPCRCNGWEGEGEGEASCIIISWEHCPQVQEELTVTRPYFLL